MEDNPSYTVRSGAVLNELIAWMRSGANVIIEIDGQPVARLIPYTAPPGNQADGSITLHVDNSED